MWLKQSTVAVINFGPMLDKTDGVTLETGAGIITSLDHATTGIKLSKNGGTLTIREQGGNFVATTYDAHGMYKVSLSAIDTGTLGRLFVIHDEAATYLPVWKEFMVVPANVYNSLIAGSDYLDVAVAEQANIDFGALQKSSLDAATPAAPTDMATATSQTSILSKLLKYVQLLARKDAGIATDNAIELTAINANGGSGAGAFSNQTDSTEAIRDRGDAEWDTATGFSAHSAADVVTAMEANGSKLDHLWEMTEDDGGVRRLTTNALEQAPTGGGGAGAISWTYTLTDSITGLPIADSHVWVTTDSAGSNVIASGTTNQLGVVTFMLDAGTVYVWRAKSGYDFTNPDTEVVA